MNTVSLASYENVEVREVGDLSEIEHMDMKPKSERGTLRATRRTHLDRCIQSLSRLLICSSRE